MAQPSCRLAKFLLEVRKIRTTDIAQFDVFEIVPNPFDGIQFRRIGRQALQMDIRRAAFGQKGFDFAIVYWGTIPNDKQFTPNVLLQMLEEADYITTA
jgi:hypothetical protein